MNIKELTDEWVEFFGKPENQNGAMWLLAKDGCFPIGVDEDDARVKRILHGSEER